MTTQEKNEVIAEFMGYIKRYHAVAKEYEWLIYNKYRTSDKLLFHSDYNWLMAAWKKFCSIPSSNFAFYDLKESLSKSILNEPITEAFDNLYSCIEWYNSVTEKQQP